MPPIVERRVIIGFINTPDCSIFTIRGIYIASEPRCLESLKHGIEADRVYWETSMPPSAERRGVDQVRALYC